MLHVADIRHCLAVGGKSSVMDRVVVELLSVVSTHSAQLRCVNTIPSASTVMLRFCLNHSLSSAAVPCPVPSVKLNCTMMRHAQNDPVSSALADMTSSTTLIEYTTNWKAFQAALGISRSFTLESNATADMRPVLRAFPDFPAPMMVQICRALYRGLRLIVESCNNSSSSSSSSNRAMKDEKLGWRTVGTLLNFYNSIYYVQQERCAVDEPFMAAFGSAASVTGLAAVASSYCLAVVC
jgi:hypothetical protein